LAVVEGPFESGDKLAAEDSTQHFDGEKGNVGDSTCATMAYITSLFEKCRTVDISFELLILTSRSTRNVPLTASQSNGWAFPSPPCQPLEAESGRWPAPTPLERISLSCPHGKEHHLFSFLPLPELSAPGVEPWPAFARVVRSVQDGDRVEPCIQIRICGREVPTQSNSRVAKLGV
jgi:hypothetical protein